MAINKTPRGLIVTADGRRFDIPSIKKRLASAGSPGISATLPSAAMPALPVLPDQQSKLPTVGSALMGANTGQTQVSLTPGAPGAPLVDAATAPTATTPFKVAAEQSRAAFTQSDVAAGIRVAPGTLDPSSPLAGRSGMQTGALRVVPDPKQLEEGSVRRELAEGFGPGNVVPAGGFQAIQQQLLDQRQANLTGTPVTTPGGRGGRSGGGGRAIQTTTTPRFEEVEASVLGKPARLPQPVAERYGAIVSGINQAAIAATNNASVSDSRGAQMANDARKAARKALSDEDKSFLAAVESGAGPQAFGLRVANKGGKTRTGESVGRTFTTALPKKRAAAKPAKMPGSSQLSFARLEKSIGTTSKMKILDRHLQAGLSQTPEIQNKLAAKHPKFGVFLSLVRDGASYEDARHEAYKVKPPKGEIIGTEGAALSIAREQLFGKEIMKKVIVTDDDGNSTEVIEGTDRFTIRPWNRTGFEGEDLVGDNPAAKKKAMRATYDEVHESLSARGYDDATIIKMFDLTVKDPFPDEQALKPEDKAIWLKIKGELGAPVAEGDMSAEAIADLRDAKARGTATTGPEGEDVPAKAAPRETPAAEDAAPEAEPATPEPADTDLASQSAEMERGFRVVTRAVNDPDVSPEQVDAIIDDLVPLMSDDITRQEFFRSEAQALKGALEEQAAQQPTTQPAAQPTVEIAAIVNGTTTPDIDNAQSLMDAIRQAYEAKTLTADDDAKLKSIVQQLLKLGAKAR